MFCYNCGEKIMDFAKFCPFCGSKQVPLEENNENPDKGLKNKQNHGTECNNNQMSLETYGHSLPTHSDEMNGFSEASRIYHIGSYNIAFDSDEVAYLDCYSVFHRKLTEYEMKFCSYRDKNINDFDAILEKSLPAIKKYMDQMIDLGIDTLLQYSIDYIDHKILQNALLEQYPIDSELADILNASQSIEQYAQQLEIESHSGMRFQGGGFGITGAISGAIKAEMLNMGMDALSGIGKMITNNTDNDKMRRYKEHLFRELGTDCEMNCFYHWCGGVFPLVYRILIEERKLSPVYFDADKASAKFNNIVRMTKQKQFTQEKVVIALLEGLKLNPLDVNYCEALLTIFPNSYDELKKFTSDCGTYAQFAEVAENIMKEHYRKGKIEKLKKYTKNRAVFDHLDNVMMNQSELECWMKQGHFSNSGEIITLYLVENEYRIPLSRKMLRYIGLGNVVVYIDSDTVIDFDSLGITFRNINLDAKYKQLVKSTKLYENGMSYLNQRNYGEAIKSLLESRNLGNGTASNLLGWIFENGLGVEADIVKANKFYDEGEERKDRIAAPLLGLACKNGFLDTEVNYNRAIFWLEKADPTIESLMELADIYAKGLGGNLNNSKASALYKRAYKLGSYQALYEYAMLSDSIEEKAKCFEKAAKHGIPNALYQVGLMHWEHYEDAFHEDESSGYRTAVDFFKKAAEQNITNALHKLGEAYMDGKGIAKSERLAVNCFRKASEQGQIDATVELGVCYANGTGVKQDYQKAVELYRLAAKEGNHEAQLNLGICYQYGAGVEKNLKEAVRWYKLSMDQGNSEAREMLQELRNQLTL